MNSSKSHKKHNSSRRDAIKTGMAAFLGGSLAHGLPVQAQQPDAAKTTPIFCRYYQDQVNTYYSTALTTERWLIERIENDRKVGTRIADLTGYFKVAYLFCIAGQVERANKIMSTMQDNFMQDNGDFMVSSTQKSQDVDYYEKIWGYANAWIIFIAHKLGRFEISVPAYQYLENLYAPGLGGYISSNPDSNNTHEIDLLTTTHVGHTALYMGKLERAETCAKLVMDFESLQPELEKGMYLRMNSTGQFIKEYPQEDSGYYYLESNKTGEFYFMAGYPIAFLGLLYRLTGKTEYLTSAIKYFDFAKQCTGVFESHFSHKIAWGAAILFNITGEETYAEFAVRVADHLVDTQHESGAWFQGAPAAISYDQSAECASWLRQIASELCSRT